MGIRTGSNKSVFSNPRMYHLLIFGGALIVLVAGAVWQGGAHDQSAERSEVTALEALKVEVSGVQSALSRNELEVIGDTMREIPKEIAASVVGIKTREESTEPFRDIAVYGLNSTPQDAIPERPHGVSGLLIHKDGYVVTSATVLQYRFPVQIAFGSFIKTADLISSDSAHHLALLKMPDPAPGLVPIDSSKIAEIVSGEWLVREGRTPSGEESRSLHFLESIHNTSLGDRIGLLNTQGAAYMDGAALVNVSGGVVGIYVHPSGSDGFVLPVRRAIDIAERLKANPAAPTYGWAGLELQELAEDLKEYFGAENGVLISSTEPEGPAAKAGLRPMDVIERIGDVEVTSPAAAVQVITQSMPGTRLAFRVRRNSRQQRIELTVSQPPGAEPSLKPVAGLLTISVRANGRGSDGLEIISVHPQSDANRLGVKAGDIILGIDGRRVLRPEQFWSYQRTLPDNKVQLWSIQRGSKQFFIAVKQRVGQL